MSSCVVWSERNDTVAAVKTIRHSAVCRSITQCIRTRVLVSRLHRPMQPLNARLDFAGSSKKPFAKVRGGVCSAGRGGKVAPHVARTRYCTKSDKNVLYSQSMCMRCKGTEHTVVNVDFH